MPSNVQQNRTPEQTISLIQQLLAKFRADYTDIKPQNILIKDFASTTPVVSYIDYSAPFIHTYMTRECAKIYEGIYMPANLLAEKKKPYDGANALLGLVITLCYAIGIAPNEYQLINDNLCFIGQQQQIQKSGGLPDTFVLSGNPLENVLNLAYRGELTMVQLIVALHNIYPNETFAPPPAPATLKLSQLEAESQQYNQAIKNKQGCTIS